MKQVELEINELYNFIKLAKEFREKYSYVIEGDIVFLTASEEFLTKNGY